MAFTSLLINDKKSADKIAYLQTFLFVLFKLFPQIVLKIVFVHY